MPELTTAAHELPVLIAGAGPAGMTTAVTLSTLGDVARVFEARGPVGTRARNIFLRPSARESLERMGVPDPGMETTINHVENMLRGAADRRGVLVDYHTKVTGLEQLSDRVRVTVQHADAATPEVVEGRMFVDASGGRFAPTSVEGLTRDAAGPNHMYVTGEFDHTPWFSQITGVMDTKTDEIIYLFPSFDRRRIFAYLDFPPGKVVDSEGALARFDTLMGQLQLGPPAHRPQAFDAQQHIARGAIDRLVMKVGDGAGNADPYTGAGVAAAIADGEVAARAIHESRGLPASDVARITTDAAAEVVGHHRDAARLGSTLIQGRPIAGRFFAHHPIDSTLTRDDLGASVMLKLGIKAFVHRPG